VVRVPLADELTSLYFQKSMGSNQQRNQQGGKFILGVHGVCSNALITKK